MIRAVLSIGSNMDDRYALLETVFEEFRDETIARSSIYSTPPWGVPDQDEFLNAILIVNVAQTPRELLHRGQRLEAAAERQRTRKWGPRTLDVDIIQVIDANGVELVSEDPELILPHPWARHRAFVLVPWLAADPEARLLGVPVREIVEKLDIADVEAVVEA